MTSVPRTVPSTPLSVMASSRQIMRNEAATKRPRKNHGAHVPVLSIQVMNDFKAAQSGKGARPRQDGFGRVRPAGSTEQVAARTHPASTSATHTAC